MRVREGQYTFSTNFWQFWKTLWKSLASSFNRAWNKYQESLLLEAHFYFTQQFLVKSSSIGWITACSLQGTGTTEDSDLISIAAVFFPKRRELYTSEMSPRSWGRNGPFQSLGSHVYKAESKTEMCKSQRRTWKAFHRKLANTTGKETVSELTYENKGNWSRCLVLIILC